MVRDRAIDFPKAHDRTQETLHFGSLYQWASLKLMRWFDGGGVGPPNGMRAAERSGRCVYRDGAGARFVLRGDFANERERQVYRSWWPQRDSVVRLA